MPLYKTYILPFIYTYVPNLKLVNSYEIFGKTRVYEVVKVGQILHFICLLFLELLFYVLFSNFYDVVLVSAIQQCRSPIIIHTSPSLASLSSPTPSLQVITEYQTEPPVLRRNFSSAIHLTPDSIYIDAISPFILLSLPTLCPQAHSLYLHLHSFPSNSLINAIFLDTIYMH